MGMVVMSKRELNRLDVLARLDSGRLTARAAAELMAITPRQTYRLLRRYRDGGASAVANQRRGRPSNNRLPDVVREHAIALVRERYADFGPTFAAEKLAERHDLEVSRDTLRSWMRQAGIWMSRAERKRIQQPRHRAKACLARLLGASRAEPKDRNYSLAMPPCAALVARAEGGGAIAPLTAGRSVDRRQAQTHIVGTSHLAAVGAVT
jgi:transposase